MGGGVVRGWLSQTRGEWALGGADALIPQSLLFQTQGQAREQVLPLFGKLGPGQGDG